ncbi:MAG TPA: GH3 auxin-responsive promoter family protein, partial [Chitinophagaceae bacterium]|nr:GH3 auxin-responsive promoter family protein [Chitinophagaceae bacterium]
FVIVGRTKQFLSLCGEHLSVDNMNKAIDDVQKKLNISIKEFTVAGFKDEGHFAHKWYIGCDDLVNPDQVLALIDQSLCRMNDDYAVERESALKKLYIEVLPPSTFIGFLQATGKYGAMNKFPRVLKNAQHEAWDKFIATQAIQSI